MLRLYINICEDFQLDAVLTLKDVEDFLSVSLLGLCKVDFIFIFSILWLSKANLVVLKYGEELFSHEILEISIVSSPDTFG